MLHVTRSLIFLSSKACGYFRLKKANLGSGGGWLEVYLYGWLEEARASVLSRNALFEALWVRRGSL